MAYLDDLKSGSFRGNSFRIEAHTKDGGRRIAYHEFPERDEPYAEDMGKKPDRFTITFHIVGEDYFGQRNRMIKALERRDSGTLIHPYLGRKEVVVDSYQMSENIEEGAIVRFTVNFLEQSRRVNPIGFLSPVFNFFNQVNDAIDGLREDFQDFYQILGLPGYIASEAIGVFDNATSLMTETIGQVTATVDQVDTVIRQIEDYGQLIPTIVSDADQVFENTLETFRGMTVITNDASDKQKLHEPFLTFNDDAILRDPLTPQGEQNNKNIRVINRLFQGLSIVEQVKWFVTSVTEPFDPTDEEAREVTNDTYFSFQDLEDRRDYFSDQIDQYIEKYPDNEDLRDVFLNFKSAMVDALPERRTDSDLRNEIIIEPKVTTPSLVLVYDQFENVDAELDFVRRNKGKIRNPAFVVGGEEYEIVDAPEGF